MKVLITGGAGYIGSHMALSLLDTNHEVIILDNLSTGSLKLVPPKATFIKGDISDLDLVNKILIEHNLDAVAHFAASIKVDESVKKPAKYYENNTVNTLRFVELLSNSKVNKLIFSSTAAIYGKSHGNLIKENHNTKPQNPYGSPKLMCEEIIKEISKISKLKFFILRYFNVAGADIHLRSGQIEEDASHLIGVCVECALQKRSFIEVFGNDYETPDGSCVRDFIHITDLINGHILALEHLLKGGESDVCNLGYGQGLSVLEIINKVKLISGTNFPVKIGNKRIGDIPHVVANNDKIKSKYNWQPLHNDIEVIIKTALNWQKRLLI